MHSIRVRTSRLRSVPGALVLRLQVVAAVVILANAIHLAVQTDWKLRSGKMRVGFLSLLKRVGFLSFLSFYKEVKRVQTQNMTRPCGM